MYRPDAAKKADEPPPQLATAVPANMYGLMKELMPRQILFLAVVLLAVAVALFTLWFSGPLRSAKDNPSEKSSLTSCGTPGLNPGSRPAECSHSAQHILAHF